MPVVDISARNAHHLNVFIRTMEIIDWMIVIRIVCDLITFPSWQFLFSFLYENERDFVGSTHSMRPQYDPIEYRERTSERTIGTVCVSAFRN